MFLPCALRLSGAVAVPSTATATATATAATATASASATAPMATRALRALSTATSTSTSTSTSTTMTTMTTTTTPPPPPPPPSIVPRSLTSSASSASSASPYFRMADEADPTRAGAAASSIVVDDATRWTIGAAHTCTTLPLSRFLPEGLPRFQRREAEMLSTPDAAYTFVCRRALRTVVDELETKRRHGFLHTEVPHIALHGAAGSGKSSLLLQTVLWARARGWLVVYVPDGVAWTSDDLIERSTSAPHLYNQNALAARMCADTLAAHADLLRSQPLREPLPRDVVAALFDADAHADAPAQPPNLAELLRIGTLQQLSYRPGNQFSTDIVRHFRRELNHVLDAPVLVAVDGVNRWYDRSNYYDPDADRVHPDTLPAERLALVDAFKDFAHHGLANGTYVVATTADVPEREFTRRLGHRRTHELAPLSFTEAYEMFANWRRHGLLQHDVSRGTAEYLYHFAGRNAKEMLRQAMTM